MRKAFQAPRQQQGVVLVVALIMMAVIGVSSAIALKSALGQDQIAANQRARSVALQGAESALRYCEAAITAPAMTAAQAAMPRVAAVAAGEVPTWATPATWVGPSANVTVLPVAYLFDGANVRYNRRPECLIQQVTLEDPISDKPGSLPPPEAYVVTARGFSPDYAENSSNTPIAGAVIWLQSTVQIRP